MRLRCLLGFHDFMGVRVYDLPHTVVVVVQECRYCKEIKTDAFEGNIERFLND